METAPSTSTTHGYEVGDIVYGSWGYDQTNVDYYLVVRTTRTKVELQPIGCTVIGTHTTSETIVPDPDSPRDHDIILETGRWNDDGRTTKLCSTRPGWNGGDSLIILNGRGHHSASRYTGPLTQTALGFGH